MLLHTPVTILVIDDEPSFTKALVALLGRDGYTVDMAENGNLALAHLEAHNCIDLYGQLL
jgi:CheY-like chemotaxis protein